MSLQDDCVPRVRLVVQQHLTVVSTHSTVAPFVDGFPSIVNDHPFDSVAHLRVYSSAPVLQFCRVQAQCHEDVYDVSSEAGLQPFLQLAMCREVAHIQPFRPRKGLVAKKVRHACRGMCYGTIELKT